MPPGAIPAAPILDRRNRKRARPCSRPGSSRRGTWPIANDAPGPRLAAVGRPQDPNRGAVRPRPAVAGNAEKQRRPGVPMPNLGRVDAMPVRDFSGAQQVIDRGTGAASAARPGLPPDFDIVPPFGWGRRSSRSIMSAACMAALNQVRGFGDQYGGPPRAQRTPRCLKNQTVPRSRMGFTLNWILKAELMTCLPISSRHCGHSSRLVSLVLLVVNRLPNLFR